jgi:N-acetylmuramoyl-L-alanine amidase
MQILDQRLVNDDSTPFPFQLSPNIGKGSLKPRFIVIHYTEGGTAAGAILWLTNPASQVSCHLVIDRDGSVTQLVPFDRIAWHAGVSSWNGVKNLNPYSIGIELDNAGMLKKTAQGWQSSFGRIYPDEEVLVATHKFGTQPAGWQLFPSAQIDACVGICALLTKEYSIQAIVGHDDIAPKRKWDPGPAFPMEELRTRAVDPFS